MRITMKKTTINCDCDQWSTEGCQECNPEIMVNVMSRLVKEIERLKAEIERLEGLCAQSDGVAGE